MQVENTKHTNAFVPVGAFNKMHFGGA